MGTFFIVATPIGNLRDMSPRAVDVLGSVDYIACEDTRRTGLLLKHLSIEKKILISYYEQNEIERIPKILNLLKNGLDVALVSDAGTPTISDPGFRLVRACIHEEVPVVSVPGPSALTSALVVSGLPTDTFLFVGYPPKKSGHRLSFFERIKNLITLDEKMHPTVILFEAPHKLVRTLEELRRVFGDIKIVLCRELTKIHEEVRREKISQAIYHLQNTEPKGEFVLLLNLFSPV